MSYLLLDAIGNTPLIEITRLNPNPRVKILAKLEYMNPGGSIKDRAALYLIEAGERSGRLTPGKTVIEATSGNTGIGLAMVCTVKGYRLLLTMSEAVSIERRKILQARGAEILLTPAHLGTDGAIEEAYRLARENPDTYFLADQFNSEANWQAHYQGTAPEIWEQTRGAVTMVVATMGTTGTLMGISRRMKEYDPAVRIVGVEPYLGHKIQGLKNMKEAYRPEIFQKERLDRRVSIEDEEAFEMARRLAREEGLLVGMSSGAAMVVALKEAAEMNAGTVAVILPDGGERYLSTPLFTVREKVSLNLFNTLTRDKEGFEPLRGGNVGVYACGPATHGRMHLGECRRLVFADFFCRYLEHREFAVNHVVNISDLDDKTVQASEKEGVAPEVYAAKHIEAIQDDLRLLGIRKGTHYPQASGHVPDMVALGTQLVQKGYAYEKLRSLYFDLSRARSYGALSGVDIRKIKVGATVDLEEYEKQNPRDFALFKRCRLSELKRGIYVPTDWGNVRPSWHIECAAIAMKYLGESYDIQISSRELTFPHDENMIAIGAALTGKPLARYWLHCERVWRDGGSGEAEGTPPNLEDVSHMGFSGREIRFWLLATHYRKPIVFSKSRLMSARRALQRIDRCVQTLGQVQTAGDGVPELDQLLYDLKQGFGRALDDDLNVSSAVAVIFDAVKRLNGLMGGNRLDTLGARRAWETLRSLDTVLNVLDFSAGPMDNRVQQLLRLRDQARAASRWEEADRIRDQLRAANVACRDAKIEPGIT